MIFHINLKRNKLLSKTKIEERKDINLHNEEMKDIKKFFKNQKYKNNNFK